MEEGEETNRAGQNSDVIVSDRDCNQVRSDERGGLSWKGCIKGLISMSSR
jgi:hypothetical protein